MWRFAVRKAAPAAAATTVASTVLLASLSSPLAQQQEKNEKNAAFAPPSWRMSAQKWISEAAAMPFATTRAVVAVAHCEEVPNSSPPDKAPPEISPEEEEEEVPHVKQGFQPDAVGDYHGHFPARQLWKPAVEYPLWDIHWDGKHPPSSGDESTDKEHLREIRKHGVTRHIICIRHGQYDETHKEDGKRVLTPLGRQQAALTGQRLATWLDADVPIRSVRVSNMTRAKETAAIITTYLPGVQMEDPDPELNEGRPCHHIPGGRASSKTIKATDDNHPRIEAAFAKYFHRADYDEEMKNEEHHHEVEIIVCHANVIRYFLCRALQLPPEAWLRYCPFNCSLTYFTIRPTGTVSCRMVGDIGHLPYEATTFSMHDGFLW